MEESRVEKYWGRDTGLPKRKRKEKKGGSCQGLSRNDGCPGNLRSTQDGRVTANVSLPESLLSRTRGGAGLHSFSDLPQLLETEIPGRELLINLP